MRRTLGLLALIGALLPGCSDKAGGGGDGGGNTDVAAAQAASGGGQSAEVGSALANPIVIYVTDGDGNAKAGVVVQATVTTGSVSPASGTTDAAGHVSFTWTLGTTNGTQTLTIHVTGLSNPVIVTATATAPALTLAVESGNNQGAIVGHALAQPIVLRVTQQHGGAGVAAVPLTLAVTGGGGNLDHTSVTTGSDGRATVHWTLGPTVGAQTFTVNGPGLAAVTVNATGTAEPVQLAIDSGGGQSGEVGTTLPQAIVARVTRQSDGGPAAGVTVSFAVATGGGSVSAASAVTDANGRARVTWTLGAAEGAQTLTVTAPGTNPQTVTATGTPELHAVKLVSGGDQAALPGTALPLPIVIKVFRQRDSVGVPGIPVTFVPFGGEGSVDQSTVTTGADGTASVVWTLGSSTGDQVLEVSTPGLQTGSVYATAGSGLTGIAQISAGTDYVCGVSTTGAAYCWGDNFSGNIADPIHSATVIPFPFLVASGGNVWTRIAAGFASTCAINTSNQMYCWGDNTYGQIGDGTTTNRPGAITPVTSSGQVWTQVVASSDRPCGLTMSNIAWCWGFNGFGAVGDGTITNRHTPVLVTGGLTFTQIDASSDNNSETTCGITTAGAAYCWGYNGDGQFGNATKQNSIVPTPVGGAYTFVKIAVGPHHTCGIVTSGAAMCWGFNGYGMLGDGTRTEHLTPTAVAGGMSFIDVAAGYRSSCGITTSHFTYCWGSSYLGQLGDGHGLDSNSPVRVAGGHHFVQISAGQDFNCGVTGTGLVFCWGSNAKGQLGTSTGTPAGIPMLIPPAQMFSARR